MTLPTLRVGSVPYVVGRPLDLALGEEEGIELVHETPASLVQGLRTYRLDVALVSSIELFRQPGYRYIDGLAVAGDGFVSSVQVFLRKPIEEVRSLALDPASRTSQVLVQALLDDRPQGAPRCLEVEPGEDPAALEADAWLRIGDRALSEYWTEPRPAAVLAARNPDLPHPGGRVLHPRDGLHRHVAGARGALRRTELAPALFTAPPNRVN
jgi:predicted solute-binding protein